MKKRQGLIIVHTGKGKGKTTAALGMALRAVGHNLRVLMVQFIKGTWKYGELESIKRLHTHFHIYAMGAGFVNTDGLSPQPEDVRKAEEAWAFAEEKVMSDDYDMIILDEINYAVNYQLISIEAVLDLVRTKPYRLHLVFTGRNAHIRLIDAADLVTEMKMIKHPFSNGIKAQKGIEF